MLPLPGQDGRSNTRVYLFQGEWPKSGPPSVIKTSLSYSHLTHPSGLYRNWIEWLMRVNHHKANQAGAPVGAVLLSRVSLLEQINIASNTTWCLHIDLFFFFFFIDLFFVFFSIPVRKEGQSSAHSRGAEDRIR